MQYKDYLSDFKVWDQKSHAKNWLLFPKNIGAYISIDETAFSNGDLYTIITNKAAKGKKGALIAQGRIILLNLVILIKNHHSSQLQAFCFSLIIFLKIHSSIYLVLF